MKKKVIDPYKYGQSQHGYQIEQLINTRLGISWTTLYNIEKFSLKKLKHVESFTVKVQTV